tara:strand:- start:776 stop:1624 length:849 start_codon:yes stop_codon:yes gene_type:complete
MNPTFSPYAELGVRPDVTHQELKQAYRQAVLRYHPDSAVGAANSLKFNAVTEAYKELRAIVDQSPREKGSDDQHSKLRKKNQLLDKEQPIDPQTLELDTPDLQQLLCESDNSHVRQVAAIALFLKKESALTIELLAIAKQPTMPSIRKAIISAMHIGPRKKVVPILLSVACESDLEIAAIAIQQIEKIDESLRGKILFRLRIAHLSLWERTKRIFDPDLLLITQYSQLGVQLRQKGLLSQEQLQIALVLQKKFPLLLGQILRQLNYVQPHELRSVLSSTSRS